jgi:basic membrane protein A
VGRANPDVTFVIEIDQKPDPIRENFFYIQRNYYVGFYVLGRIAAMKTETGTIGYVGGLELPFTRGEINALGQALEDSGKDIEFEYVFVGDFNDAVKSRQAAEGLIGKGADVLISAVNLGNFGLYKAVKQAERPVYLTTTYTSKEEQAPEHYLTSDLFDFRVPLRQIIRRILDGETSGFVPMRYGPEEARYTEFPVKNVSEEINRRVKAIADKVVSGEIEVKMNLQEIEE